VERRPALRIAHIGTYYGTRSKAIPEPMLAPAASESALTHMNLFHVAGHRLRSGHGP